MLTGTQTHNDEYSIVAVENPNNNNNNNNNNPNNNFPMTNEKCHGHNFVCTLIFAIDPEGHFVFLFPSTYWWIFQFVHTGGYSKFVHTGGYSKFKLRNEIFEKSIYINVKNIDVVDI